jgi:3-oxoacyl-[acyl-carrier-protein] synthase III
VSIGANLHEANIKGLIHEDDIVAIGGPGAGYHYCAAILRWGK